MNQDQQRQLKAKLSLLTEGQRRQLYKRAAQIRKAAPKPTSRRLIRDEDDDGNVMIRRQAQASPLDEIVLRLLLQEDEEQEVRIPTDLPLLRVLSVHQGEVDLLDGNEVRRRRLSGELRQSQQTDIAVGDWVLVENEFVTGVAPRRTKLARPDPGNVGRERVLVANVDTVVIVVSVGAPPLHPRIIDRFLIGIQKGGARPVIAVNKMDLLSSPEELAVLDAYRALGLPVLAVSAERGSGLEALRGELRGLSAFVGHSGVGKSSLVNALKPGMDLEVRASSNGRGTHTTRYSTLYQLGEGVEVIDTPGVRSFGLWELRRDELVTYFPEFSEFTCRFRDCTHTHEPGCAVKEARECGEVSDHRFETYLRLLEGLS